ncbi:DUF2946 family protein [Sedimentitalea arenosa]|uniref:DUF2946 family protein n=1 Tax=Sedimentitalea arenosa TaxID=2798803 RepID=UPI002E295885|nr:DUF2946 family protein [Arenibacterium arenosum]
MRPAKSNRIKHAAGLRQRCFGAWIGVIALVLQVFLPVSAQASGGAWIEICGENGVEMVRVDLSDADSTPSLPATCQGCCPCVLGASVPPGVPPLQMAMPTAPDVVTHLQGSTEAEIESSAARLWPETRGPPLPHMNMTLTDLPYMTPLDHSMGRAAA